MGKFYRATLTRFSLYKIRTDDERFKLSAGDIVVGVPYSWDKDKTSIAFRIRDGYRPECNQYNSNVIALTDEQTERVMWGGKA